MAAEFALAARLATVAALAALALGIARAALVVALAAIAATAPTAIAIVAPIAVASRLAVAAGGSGRGVLGFATAEEALQPAEEAAGFFLRFGLRRVILARFEIAIITPRFTGLARVARLARLALIARITVLAWLPGRWILRQWRRRDGAE